MYRELDISLLDANPAQPRQLFDETRLAELASSIRKNGLLEPIVVRPVADRYVVVAGERRRRACLRADIAVVDCRILDINEVDAYVLAIAENLNRADMTIMEEARAFDQLRRYGKATDEIADLYGKNPGYVSLRLDLTRLCDEVAGLVEKGAIRSKMAWSLSCLNPDHQQYAATRYVKGDFAHEYQAVHFAQALLMKEQQSSLLDLPEHTPEYVEQRNRVRTVLDQLSRMEGGLVDVTACSPEDLVQMAGGQIDAYADLAERLVVAAQEFRLQMRSARALAETRVIGLNPEALPTHFM